MKQFLIGITGYAQSGKDATGDILGEYGFERIAFADPLKEIALMLGWDGKKDERGRSFLQDIGNRARAYNPDIWIDRALEMARGKERVVFTDVRFLNEAAAIQARGGIIIRVVRPDVGPANNDVSETELDLIRPDYLLNNSTSLDDLQQNVERLMETLNQTKSHESPDQNRTGSSPDSPIPRSQEQDLGEDAPQRQHAVVH